MVRRNALSKRYLNAKVMISLDRNTGFYPEYIYDYEVVDDRLILHGIRSEKINHHNNLLMSEILPYIMEGYKVEDENGHEFHSYEYIDDFDFYGDGEKVFVFYTGERYFRDRHKRQAKSFAKGNYKEWNKRLP